MSHGICDPCFDYGECELCGSHDDCGHPLVPDDAPARRHAFDAGAAVLGGLMAMGQAIKDRDPVHWRCARPMSQCVCRDPFGL